MRVLFVTGEFPPMQGGVGDCTNEIAKALVALSVNVHVLTSIHADVYRHSPLVIHPVVRTWNWACLRVISEKVREFSPDVIHIQFQTAAFGMRPVIYFLPRVLPLLEKKTRTRVVVTFHDLRPPYLFPKAGLVRDWITRELARASDAVIATNELDYAKLETHVQSPGKGRSWKSLSLIPIGSNIPTTPPRNYQRQTWRAQLGVAENETLLCYFGFLNQSKGGETLIRALALVPDARLLMIGGQTGASDPTNAVYLARVKGLVADLGLSNRVMWTDYTPPEIVTANFLASDICVLPYREGASFRHGTLMAALAHGMAIVTTQDQRLKERDIDAPSSPDLPPPLKDSRNCVLVPPDDPRALADAIQRAISSPELRTKISAGALGLAQYFAWDKIAHQHLDLYQRLLQSK